MKIYCYVHDTEHRFTEAQMTLINGALTAATRNFDILDDCPRKLIPREDRKKRL